MGYTPPSRKCKCGYTHPGPWDERCPIILAEQGKLDEQSERIKVVCSKLEAKLCGLADTGVRDTVLDKIEKMIKVL